VYILLLLVLLFLLLLLSKETVRCAGFKSLGSQFQTHSVATDITMSHFCYYLVAVARLGRDVTSTYMRQDLHDNVA